MARFDRALELLRRGRGAGASSPAWARAAIVARKIAATLASTGTPALFVHPAEASHGDLGMIAERDAVIALSYSGGTAELADIIAYAKRFRLPLIAVTAGPRARSPSRRRRPDLPRRRRPARMAWPRPLRRP